MRDDAVLGHALPLDRGLGPAEVSIRGFLALNLRNGNVTPHVNV